MTEAEWLKCADPRRMLSDWRESVSDRKLRLFAVACCRRIWDHLVDERSRRAVDVAERFADGRATADECRAATYADFRLEKRAERDADARKAVRGQYDYADEAVCAAVASASYCTRPTSPWVQRTFVESTCTVARNAVRFAAAARAGMRPGGRPPEGYVEARLREDEVHARWVRDVIGNPNRPVTLNPAWLIPGVTSLAQTIYDGQAFHRMPELADALERAGCTDADILGHCRGPGPHVRGCWVVDLILGKA